MAISAYFIEKITIGIPIDAFGKIALTPLNESRNALAA